MRRAGRPPRNFLKSKLSKQYVTQCAALKYANYSMHDTTAETSGVTGALHKVEGGRQRGQGSGQSELSKRTVR